MSNKTWFRSGRIGVLGISLCLLVCGVFAADEADIHTRKPVTNGFLFVDGVYFEPHYIFQRKGYALYVNDALISPSNQWIHLLTDLREDVDPELPSGLTRESKFADIVERDKPRWKGFLSKKYRYLFQNFPREEAIQLQQQTFS